MEADQIVPFDYNRDYKHFIRLEIERFDQPMTRTLTDFLLNRYGDEFWYVIDYDGTKTIDAYIIAGVEEEVKLHIYSIAVREKYEGKRLAARLLEYLIQKAREKNLVSIYLEVRENNKRAIGLYQSRGFVQTGITKNYYEKGLHAIRMEFNMTN